MSVLRTKIINDIYEKINQYEHIVLLHHIRPDGDCLGAQMGLKIILELNFPEKKIYAIGDAKSSFEYLEIKHDLIPDFKILDESLLIILDASDIARIECNEIIKNKHYQEIIRIDHHPNSDDLNASLSWVDDEFAATCEQLIFLTKKLNWKINSTAATFLYLGIYTDTGRFLFESTTRRTLSLAGWLLQFHPNRKLIHKQQEKKSWLSIQLKKTIYEKIQIKENVIYCYIDLKTQKKLKIDDPLFANRPNVLANIDNYCIWVYFTQEKTNIIRCEFRSNGPIVRNVALKWNGGGHELASGAQIKDAKLIPEIIDDCVKLANNYISKKKY